MNGRLFGFILIFVIVMSFVWLFAHKERGDEKRDRLWQVDPDGYANREFPYWCRCKYRRHIPKLKINGRQWRR